MTKSEYNERFKELRLRSRLGAEAFRYAFDCRMRILPLAVQGKLPLASLVPNGCSDASNDPEQIIEWWTKEPNANIGFVPGWNGLLGIDVDGPVGRESLRKLEAELGVLPATWQVHSGRVEQGDHFYFRVPDDLDIKNLNGWREGIDLKFKGGYLILPPSVHASGNRYKFVNRPFTSKTQAATLPENWVAALPLHSTPITAHRSPSRQGAGMSSLEQARKIVREARSRMKSRIFPVALSFSQVKAKACGKWKTILELFRPGITEAEPNGNRYGTCPVCGKEGAFRFFDEFNETGSCICCRCHEKAGDGIATVAWLLDCSPNEARELLSDLLK